MNPIRRIAEECFVDICHDADIDDGWMNPGDRECYIGPIESAIRREIKDLTAEATITTQPKDIQ